MKFIEPRIFLLAETQINPEGLEGYLEDIGAPDWTTDSYAGAEVIAEVAGRACYRSFAPGLNLNVKRVREGNNQYLGNILKQHHGSVIEHGSVTFAVVGCSRVFTHELVRHRLCAFSQESLRFVRLSDLEAWFPDIFKSTEGGVTQNEHEMRFLFRKTFEDLESVQKAMANILGLDDMDFSGKKKMTSAMRRLAPLGLATQIIFTTNHRNLRHMISQRSAIHSEEEIRMIFLKIGAICKDKWPNIYQDMTSNEDGDWVFEHEKI